MESVAILKIRLQGIIGCIDNYTSEPTITTIKDSLVTALLENNFEIILFACKEIDKWYEKNIAEILSNDFVHNKSVHKENCELIKSIITDLEENSEKYTDTLIALKKSTSIKDFGLNDL